METVMGDAARAVLAYYQNQWRAECERIVNTYLIPAIGAAEKGTRPEELTCDVHAETSNMQKANTMNITQFASIAAPQDIWGGGPCVCPSDAHPIREHTHIIVA